jgi:predicted ATPase
MAHFTPQALLARIADPLGDSSLMLLADGARNLPLRHQTLRGAIAWSYNLLTADAQRLFRRLAVFSGSCTAQAVEDVCHLAGDRLSDARDHLVALIDHSLLRRAAGADGEVHYTMLETIRAYALEQLLITGEEPILRRRHAEHYLTLAGALGRSSY